MEHRDIVVIGGSAGALQPLQHLLGDLPAELAAALFVVIHTEANAHSALDCVLHRFDHYPAIDQLLARNRVGDREQLCLVGGSDGRGGSGHWCQSSTV